MGISGDSQSWNTVREHLRSIGEVPAPIRRSFRAMYDGGNLSYDKFLSNMLSQPTFKSSLLDTLKFLNLRPDPETSILELTKALSSKDLLSLVFCELLSNKLRAAIPSAWSAAEQSFNLRRRVGAKIGVAVGRIGAHAGLLLGPLRIAGYIVMSHTNPGSFQEYEKTLGQCGKWTDHDLEYRMWKCTNHQVASQLLTHFGVPAEIANNVNTALLTPLGSPLAATPNCYRIAAVWTECLSSGKDLPEINGDEEFLMEESKMESLLGDIEVLRSQGPTITHI